MTRTEQGKLAKGQELEVEHLVTTLSVSPKQARELLARYGNDWERIRQETELLLKEGKS